MRRAGIAALLAALALPAAVVPLDAQQGAYWRGYAQVRFTEGSGVQGFSVRRAKLWIAGPAPVGEHLYFKVQGLFRPRVSGAFVLQDVYAEYRWRLGSVRAGQLVPDFSLQRHQPDFEIPLVERAAIINMLIPSATTLARDIGAQVTLGSRRSWHASLGLFNGNGANHLANEDKKFLATGRATYTAALASTVAWEFGASAAYRRSDGIDLSKILGDSQPFAGTDFRWGIETHVSSRRWEIQAEYLEARLGNDVARGYYAVADLMVSNRNQIVASTELIHVPNPGIRGDSWYSLGLNHYISGHRAKLMIDGRAQFADQATDYIATVQFQLMFR